MSKVKKIENFKKILRNKKLGGSGGCELRPGAKV